MKVLKCGRRRRQKKNQSNGIGEELNSSPPSLQKRCSPGNTLFEPRETSVPLFTCRTVREVSAVPSHWVETDMLLKECVSRFQEIGHSRLKGFVVLPTTGCSKICLRSFQYIQVSTLESWLFFSFYLFFFSFIFISWRVILKPEFSDNQWEPDVQLREPSSLLCGDLNRKEIQRRGKACTWGPVGLWILEVVSGPGQHNG